MISGETLFSKGLLPIEGNTPIVVLIGSMKIKNSEGVQNSILP
jgi:surface protein